MDSGRIGEEETRTNIDTNPSFNGGDLPTVGKPTTTDSGSSGNEVTMDKSGDRAVSFFAQPGILAGKFILILCFPAKSKCYTFEIFF